MPNAPRLTGLQPDPFQPGAIRLLVDGKPYCSVPASSQAAARVEVGQVIDPETRTRIETAADAEAAYRTALGALERRPFSKVELERRLLRRGHPPDAVEAAVARATAAGLIDDRRFALHFVQTRAARGRGPARLRRDLRAVGVENAVIDEALANGWPEDTDPAAAAVALACKRAAQLGSLPAQVKRRRLLGYLARRGYSGALRVEAVRRALASVERRAEARSR